MPTDRTSNPPGYAWDWLARQRLVWIEASQRLAEVGRAARAPHPDIPDWTSLLADPAGPRTGPSASAAAPDAPRDWSSLRTRADVLAALRADYPRDAHVRSATDAAVTDLAFLGRLDVPLEERGVRSVPRGMRWWWTHLGGAAGRVEAAVGTTARDSSVPPSAPEPRRTIPLQLQLADVMAGYGDGEPMATRGDGR